MGIRTVFTDHSLFGFDDAASILTNKLLEGTLKNVDAVICVSHIGYVFPWSCFLHLSQMQRRRENTVLRGRLLEESDKNPSTLAVRQNVYVIPNAIIADHFKPSAVPTTTPQTSNELDP